MATDDNEKMVKVSTNYSSTIQIKHKTYVLFLRTPDILEVYGPGINPGNPMILTLAGTNDPPILEKEFCYDEEDIWNCIKAHKKAMKKSGTK